MPRVAGKVTQIQALPAGLFAVIRLDGKLPRVGDEVTLKWGSVRTHSQNALYWVYLNWLINEGGLRNQGHFTAEALHLDLKAHFLSAKIFSKGQFEALEEATTTDLGKAEFGEYFDKVNEFMKDFFNVDTAPFWSENADRKL